MRRRLLASALLALVIALPAHAQSTRETPAALPDGPGRDVTFHVCTPCHSTAVIRRSGLTRPQWDELMDWMSEKHAMPRLNPALRTMVVDYLAASFPPRRTAPRGGANPFAE
jgi:hypothetical protein